MPVPILCLAAFMLVLWVAYLKFEVQRLRDENEKLQRALKEKLGKVAGELAITGARKLPVSKSGIVTERF